MYHESTNHDAYLILKIRQSRSFNVIKIIAKTIIPAVLACHAEKLVTQMRARESLIKLPTWINKISREKIS